MVELTLLEDKLRNLQENLAGMKSILVAFSGGVDSTFLLSAAHEVLESRAVAITIASELHSPNEIQEARKIAAMLGSPHEVVYAKILDLPGLKENPPSRCYLCKRHLFSKLKEMASQRDLAYVVDGSNADDLGDYRPGMAALTELGIRSPLMEAGLTKEEIRLLSKERGLPTWNKPTMACLATRFPYGIEFTEADLGRVEEAERFLRTMGLYDVRVRHHGDMARIETGRNEMMRCIENADAIVTKLKGLGYVYIALDLQGYRSGSMNVGLSHSLQDVHAAEATPSDG